MMTCCVVLVGSLFIYDTFLWYRIESYCKYQMYAIVCVYLNDKTAFNYIPILLWLGVCAVGLCQAGMSWHHRLSTYYVHAEFVNRREPQFDRKRRLWLGYVRRGLSMTIMVITCRRSVVGSGCCCWRYHPIGHSTILLEAGGGKGAVIINFSLIHQVKYLSCCSCRRALRRERRLPCLSSIVWRLLLWDGRLIW